LLSTVPPPQLVACQVGFDAADFGVSFEQAPHGFRPSGQVLLLASPRAALKRQEEKLASIGYARVSTDGQTLAAQDAALVAAGCVKIYSEKISGARSDRPQLTKLLKQLGEGDTVVVTRLRTKLNKEIFHLTGERKIAEANQFNMSSDGELVIRELEKDIFQFESCLPADFKAMFKCNTPPVTSTERYSFRGSTHTASVVGQMVIVGSLGADRPGQPCSEFSKISR
jgi:Resolvase, N terminal domain